MTLEMGKPLAQTRGEVPYAAEYFRWGTPRRRLGSPVCGRWHPMAPRDCWPWNSLGSMGGRSRYLACAPDSGGTRP